MCIRDSYRDYRNYVEKASFMELTPEFLQTNMPQTWATLPESAWEETYVAVSYTHLDVYKRQS